MPLEVVVLIAMRARVFLRTVPLALAWSLAALAEPTPEARALARSLFDEGRALGHEGRFPEACPKLEESQRLDPGLGTGFNLADCYEHVGRSASAWSLFGEVADAALHAGQAERERVARARALALEPRLGRLVVRAPPGVVVTLDGRAVGSGALGSAMPVDPGDHRLEANAPGKRGRASTVRVFEARTTNADVAVLEDEPAVAPSPPPAPALAPTPSGPPPTATPSPDGVRTAPLLTAGVSVVALGLGTFFGLRARAKWSEAQPHCPAAVCDDVGFPAWNEARSNATASTVSFVIAGVAAATAVVLWIVATPGSSAAQRSAAQPLTTWRF